MGAALLGAALAATLVGAAEPRLRVGSAPDEAGFGTAWVEGVDLSRLEGHDLERDVGSAILAVHVGEPPAPPGQPPMLGDWRVDSGVLRFRPRLSFEPGLTYHLRLDPAALARLLGSASDDVPLVLAFRLPAAEGAAPEVVALYPSGSELPENLLRLYVHFSQPMLVRDGQVGVHLFHEGSGEVALPFVDVPDGLWDPAGTRLTLFLHPGRLKRGVAPRAEQGPPLLAGQEYRLVVEGLRDVAGRPLVPFERRFRAGPEDRRSPRSGEWRLAAPGSPTDPLIVDFAEPLDHGLLARLIEVEGAAGPVAGRVEISSVETRWTFHPDARWSCGPHVLQIHPAIEDRAGNSFARTFEEPRDGVVSPEARPAQQPTPLRVPFEACAGS